LNWKTAPTPAISAFCWPSYSCLGALIHTNESINSLVWMRAPKHEYDGQQKAEMAGVGAVFQFNEGASGKHLVMEKAGIAGGKHWEQKCIKRQGKDQQCKAEVIPPAKKDLEEDKGSKTEGRGGEKVNGRNFIWYRKVKQCWPTPVLYQLWWWHANFIALGNGVILCRKISAKLSKRDNFNFLIFRDRFSKSAFFATSELKNLKTLKVFNEFC